MSVKISTNYKTISEKINPEKFVKIPLEVIEGLQDFNNWKAFISDPNYIEEKSMKVIEEINLNKKYETCPWDNYSGTHFGY